MHLSRRVVAAATSFALSLAAVVPAAPAAASLERADQRYGRVAPAPAALRMLAAEGEDARVLSGVPVRLMIADERTAILPLALDETGVDGIVVMHATPLIVAMKTLFESLWRVATPVGAADESRNRVPGEHQLLELLSSGMTDRAIGYQLGVSARTVQRRVRRLLDITRARSRTQLLLERTRPPDRPQ
jgi:DNA-binding NarL/FixJ family response regulator